MGSSSAIDFALERMRTSGAQLPAPFWRPHQRAFRGLAERVVRKGRRLYCALLLMNLGLLRRVENCQFIAQMERRLNSVFVVAGFADKIATIAQLLRN